MTLCYTTVNISFQWLLLYKTSKVIFNFGSDTSNSDILVTKFCGNISKYNSTIKKF